jgi:hypothetical protein
MQNAPLESPPQDPRSASIRPLSFKNYIDKTQPVLSPCNKTSFPWPERHTDLPWLADVFASPEAEYVNFVGTHRGIWMPEFEQADAFARSSHSTKPHRFICVFPRNVHVLSEFMHPVGYKFKPHSLNNFVIRCQIPKEFQHLVEIGQTETSLHVDLHAIKDLEDPIAANNEPHK